MSPSLFDCEKGLQVDQIDGASLAVRRLIILHGWLTGRGRRFQAETQWNNTV